MGYFDYYHSITLIDWLSIYDPFILNFLRLGHCLDMARIPAFDKQEEFNWRVVILGPIIESNVSRAWSSIQIQLSSDKSVNLRNRKIDYWKENRRGDRKMRKADRY